MSTEEYSVKPEEKKILWCDRFKNKYVRRICINLTLLVGNSGGSLRAILMAFITGGIILAILGYNPFQAYGLIFQGAFAGKYAITESLVIATPLIFTALSFAIAYRCGVINLGAEGQLYIGAVASGFVAIYADFLPGPLLMIASILAGFIGGALWGFIAGWLKVKFGASELITTIMMNYIGINLVGYLVFGPMREPGAVEPFSRFVQESARLSVIVPGSRLSLSFILALVAIVFYFLFLWKTTIGYEMRVVGQNKEAARYAGIHVNRRALLAMIIAGGFAGLAGASEVLSTQFRVYSNVSKGLGFDGIAIALVGANAPIGILFSGIFFGAMRGGAGLMQVMMQTPVSVIDMLFALIIIFITAPMIYEFFKERIKRFRLSKGGVDE